MILFFDFDVRIIIQMRTVGHKTSLLNSTKKILFNFLLTQKTMELTWTVRTRFNPQTGREFAFGSIASVLTYTEATSIYG